MLTEKLIIIGASYAFEIIEIVNSINLLKSNSKKIVIIGILDDNNFYKKKKINKIPVLGKISDTKKYPNVKFIININSQKNLLKKEKIFNKYIKNKKKLITLIHPNVFISPDCRIGNGVVISPFVNIYPNSNLNDCVRVFSFTNIAPYSKIGAFTCIASGVTIGVNSKVERTVLLATNLSLVEILKFLKM